jgi:uncharacterized protein DUF3108
MNRVLGFAGVVCAAALSTAAFAQQPLAPIAPNQHIVPSDPVVVKSGEVVTMPQAAPQVATTAPADTAAPAEYVATATPQAAPYKPAPLGTYIETTADKRVIITETGYLITSEINGRRDTSIAMLTEGLGGGQVYPPGVPAQFWPLQVGKQVTFNYGAGSPLSVTARVLRTETITVPAGTFYTYVIERQSHPSSSYGESVATFWYAPSVGTVVKATSYVALGGGGIRPFEATSIVLPHPLNGIPVTIPGDTAAKRAEFCTQRGTTLAMPNGSAIPVPCITYVQTHLVAYGAWVNGGEAASVPVTR